MKSEQASLNHGLHSIDCLYLLIGTFIGLAVAGAYRAVSNFLDCTSVSAGLFKDLLLCFIVHNSQFPSLANVECCLVLLFYELQLHLFRSSSIIPHADCVAFTYSEVLKYTVEYRHAEHVIYSMCILLFPCLTVRQSSQIYKYVHYNYLYY